MMQVSPPRSHGPSHSVRQGTDGNRDRESSAWRHDRGGDNRASSSGDRRSSFLGRGAGRDQGRRAFSWRTDRDGDRQRDSGASSWHADREQDRRGHSWHQDSGPPSWNRRQRIGAKPSRPARPWLGRDEHSEPCEKGGDPADRARLELPFEYESNTLYKDLKGDRRNHVGSGLTPDQALARAEAKLRKLAARYGVKSPVEKTQPSASSPEAASWPVDAALLSRLEALGAPVPLQIQEAAFAPISEGHNVAIHSETGSGKTLAYIVPMLASMNCSQKYHTLIVVPSGSLARQVKAVVDSLLPAVADFEGAPCEFARIIGGEGNDVSKKELERVSDSPILIGTPHTVRRFASDLAQDFLLEEHLERIVLDEADDLLKSSQLANLQQQFHYSDELLEKKFDVSETERMLRDLPMSLDEIQFICASATVGQTLLRQIQSLLKAPSIPRAITLVSGKDLASEIAKSRSAALMPSTLEHRWVLVEEKDKNSDEDAELHNAVFHAMDQLAPGPAIIFGKGKQVKTLIKALKARGFKNVQHLKDAHGDNSIVQDIGQSSEHNIKMKNGGIEAWATTPVYTGGEKDARGLDLTVDYVFLLSPPLACSKYVHLAGRTGRNGRHGSAITLAKHHQAPDLVSFSEKLCVAITRLDDHESSNAA